MSAKEPHFSKSAFGSFYYADWGCEDYKVLLEIWSTKVLMSVLLSIYMLLIHLQKHIWYSFTTISTQLKVHSWLVDILLSCHGNRSVDMQAQ